MEENYERLRKDYNEMIEKNMGLEVEVERQKENVWQERHNRDVINQDDGIHPFRHVNINKQSLNGKQFERTSKSPIQPLKSTAF